MSGQDTAQVEPEQVGTTAEDYRTLSTQVQTLAKELHYAGKELIVAAENLRAHGANTCIVDRARRRGMHFLAEAGALLDV